MTSMMPVLCNSCIHRRAGGSTCDAFPSAIPRGILVYGDDHRKPIQHQGNSIVFEMRQTETAREDFNDWMAFHQSGDVSAQGNNLR